MGGPGAEAVVAVVGRPNVGKSTLVNRLIGRRLAVVEDVPGVTRDRVVYETTWSGRPLSIVDTGGWASGASGLAARIAEAASVAAAAADLVLFVVDTTVGATEEDAAVARLLQRAGRPVLLVANKVDGERDEPEVGGLWRLGLGQPYPVSALHGRGSGDLLDAVLEHLPPADPVDRPPAASIPRVALIGRPNVGKSSLLNRLTGSERALVDAAAGTTRDPVDELVDLGGQTWRFVDTAGIRRRVRQASGVEYYANLRTASALESAEVAVVILDASDHLTEQDQRVIAAVVEAGRALVLVFNKWDLLDDDRRVELDREVDRDLARLSWAPRVNVSARTGRGLDRLPAAMRLALDGWQTRVSTARLNVWLTDVVAATPPPPRGGRATKILFATQPAIRPPRLVLFTSGVLSPGYQRFLERRAREEFGFPGSPLEIEVRLRQRRGGPRTAR